jgi:hypothetical protein
MLILPSPQAIRKNARTGNEGVGEGGRGEVAEGRYRAGESCQQAIFNW